jgi:hypothetical protein
VHFVRIRRILATYRAISGQKRGLFVANHAHRIRRKPRFWGTIIENRRLERERRRLDRDADAYFNILCATGGAYLDFAVPPPTTPVADVRAVIERARAVSVPITFRDVTPEAQLAD